MNSSKYIIEVDPKAARDLKKLRRTNFALTKRIIKLIESIPSNPSLGKPLKGYKRGCYSLRSGDYRINYEVYVSRKIIHIIRVGHRKDIYR